MSANKKEFFRTLKYIAVAASAGVIQIVSALLLETVIFKNIIPAGETLNIGIKTVDKSSFIAESVGLALSVVWNFTFNRKFTFKAATNVPLSMALAFLFYVPFYPFQIWYIDTVRNALIAPIGEDFAFVIAQLSCMAINFVLEFLWQRFVVFGKKVDSANSARARSVNLYIFDCFGVVVSDISTIWMNKHFEQAEQVQMRKLFRKVDCGEISFDSAFEILAQTANIPLQIARAEWDADLVVLTDTVKLIDSLRAEGHRVALLSNADRAYIDEIFAHFDLHKHFDYIYVSSDYGCAKPDKEFYQICLDDCAESCSKIFFTDDNPKNLEGIQALGITPILFRGADDLRKFFRTES